MEPRTLRRGKVFDSLVGRFYRYQAENAPDKFYEQISIRKLSGKRGRMDLFTEILNEDLYVSIIETKCTLWDSIQTRGETSQYLESHSDQVYEYLFGEINLNTKKLRRVLTPATVDALSEHAHLVPRRRSRDGFKHYAWVDVEKLDRTPGIVYPRVPQTPGLRGEIDAFHEQRGIAVVWFEEPPPSESPAGEAWIAYEKEIQSFLAKYC